MIRSATIALLTAAAVLAFKSQTGQASSAPPASAPLQVTSLESLFVGIADHAIPSVASISTTKAMPRLATRGGRIWSGRLPREPISPFDLWQDFFAGGGQPPTLPPGANGDDAGSDDGDSTAQRPMALGSGFVVEAYEHGGGLLLTNNHVIHGADGIRVKFTERDDERETPAKLIGADPDLDVALLEVKTDRKLVAVPLGDSESLKVGEWIAAVGNPFGHGHSVTHGIVSAKERSLPGGFGQYLQVDAPINPGNSGGPLLNLQGEVVGINNAIDARGPGIGFAIPINAVRSILPQLKSSGHVDRGYIGLAVGPNPAGGGPIVAEVIPGGPAARARLMRGDAITAVNGQAVHSPAELVAAVSAATAGSTLTAEVTRDGRVLHVSLTVAHRPDPSALARADQ